MLYLISCTVVADEKLVNANTKKNVAEKKRDKV